MFLVTIMFEFPIVNFEFKLKNIIALLRVNLSRREQKVANFGAASIYLVFSYDFELHNYGFALDISINIFEL